MPPETTIPVYDTAWQLFSQATPKAADLYFEELARRGFAGCWAFLFHHPPARHLDEMYGGGSIGFTPNGELETSTPYRDRVLAILDMADKHGMKVGFGVAWQNSYMLGGVMGHGVVGTVNGGNIEALADHVYGIFNDHPAISMWVTGGDAGSNNTNANRDLWARFANRINELGNTKTIAWHSPTADFGGHLNYKDEEWLDVAALETGHQQSPANTQEDLEIGVAAYRDTEVWQGEPRYAGRSDPWVQSPWSNPGPNEIRADAEAAKSAGVKGYVFGTWARWRWFGSYGDRNQPQLSFGAAEDAVIDVFTVDEVVDPPSGDLVYVIVRAEGETGTEQLRVTTDGVTRATFALTTDLENHIVMVPRLNAHELRVHLVDGNSGPAGDANAYILSATVDGTTHLSRHEQVYSVGSWRSSDGCAGGYKQSSWLHCTGYFDYSEIIPPFGAIDPPIDPPVDPPIDPPVDPPEPCPPFTEDDFLAYVIEQGRIETYRVLIQQAFDAQNAYEEFGEALFSGL